MHIIQWYDNRKLNICVDHPVCTWGGGSEGTGYQWQPEDGYQGQQRAVLPALHGLLHEVLHSEAVRGLPGRIPESLRRESLGA